MKASSGAAAGYTDMGFNSFFGLAEAFLSEVVRSRSAVAQRMCRTDDGIAEFDFRASRRMFASLPPGARLVRQRDPYADLCAFTSD